MNRYRHLALAVALLLLAGWLRVHDLGAASLWLDEVHSYNRAALADWPAVYRLLRAKNHAPLYDAVILHHWLRLGSGEFLVRLPAVFFGLGTVPLVHATGRRLFGPAIALVAALLLAFSPIHLYYSREVRMYTQVTFFVMLSVYLLQRGLSGPPRVRWPYFLGYTLSSALALYTHYFAGFALISLAAFATVYALFRHGRSLLPSVILSNFGVALLFAPWLPTFWAQLNGNPVAWLPEPDAELLSNIFSRFFLNQEVFGGVLAYWEILLVVALSAGVFLAWQQRRSAPAFARSLAFLATAAAGPVLIALAVSMIKPLILGRYLLIVVPPVALLAAVGCVALWRRPVTRPVVLLILFGVIMSGYGVATADSKPDWSALASYLERNATLEDVIVVYPGNLGTTLDHYYTGPQERLYVARDSSAAAALDPLEAGRFWLVSTVTAESDPLIEGMLAYADSRFRRQECRDFGQAAWRARLCLYQNNPSAEK